MSYKGATNCAQIFFETRDILYTLASTEVVSAHFDRRDKKRLVQIAVAPDGTETQRTLSVKKSHEVLDRQVTAVFELTGCRAIESFEIYLGELITAVLLTYPNQIRALPEANYPIKRIVEVYDSQAGMQELLADVISQEVTKLTLGGVDCLILFIRDKLKLPVLTKNGAYKTAIEFSALRNLFVHNRGVVNRMYLKRLETFGISVSKRVGDRVTMDPITIIETLGDWVAGIDYEAIRKWPELIKRPKTKRSTK